MGLKYDIKWQNPDKYSRVVVINSITNLNEEFNLQKGI